MEGQEQKPVIYLYTDGAASGNPGPGGWGVVLTCAGLRKEMSGGFARTTNNRMELLAVIMGLEAIRWDRARVEVWSDSTYVVKAVTEGWLDKWLATGFKKKKNADLWLRFNPLYRRHEVQFHWLKGQWRHTSNRASRRIPAMCRKKRIIYLRNRYGKRKKTDRRHHAGRW